MYYGTGSDCIFVLGPGARDRRAGTLADVEDMAALQEKLPNIDFVLSMVHPHELPADIAPVAQFAAMLRGTSKPLIMVPEDAEHLELFNEMAAACGAADSWALYAMPTPPLIHGKESADRLVRCARAGHPDGLRHGVPARAPRRPPRRPAASWSPTPRCSAGS